MYVSAPPTTLLGVIVHFGKGVTAGMDGEVEELWYNYQKRSRTVERRKGVRVEDVVAAVRDCVEEMLENGYGYKSNRN